MTASTDLSTTYLGFRLPHPFIVGASPLVDHLDTVRRLEDAGCAAIVMHSLFEEQITAARSGRIHHLDPSISSSPPFFPISLNPSGTRSVLTHIPPNQERGQGARRGVAERDERGNMVDVRAID